MLQPDSTEEFKRVIETALLAAPAPLPVSELRRLFEDDPGAELVRHALFELVNDWQGRGAKLVQTAGGWRFQTRLEYQVYLDRLKQERPPKYSRAVLETLAIIAYRQPVTRGDIEDIRGVVVSTNEARPPSGEVPFGLRSMPSSYGSSRGSSSSDRGTSVPSSVTTR